MVLLPHDHESRLQAAGAVPQSSELRAAVLLIVQHTSALPFLFRVRAVADGEKLERERVWEDARLRDAVLGRVCVREYGGGGVDLGHVCMCQVRACGCVDVK